MTTQYDHHEVTTKAAIYSDNPERVLIMEYLPAKGETGFGLPGGHVDTGEEAPDAMRRELREELGVELSRLELRDIFRHQSGKLVVAYVVELATIPPQLLSEEPTKERGVWMTKLEFDTIDINPAYRKFVLDNWPDAA